MSTPGNGGNEARKRIKRLRLFRRWDQSTLAQRAGLSTSTISNLELGRVAPTADQIHRVASALGYSPEFLAAELRLQPTTRPWLRAYADAGKREADARRASASLAAEYIRVIGLKPIRDAIPAFGGAAEDDEAIEEAAAELRSLANLKADAVVPNAVRAAERLGCVVLPLESELGRHVGMSVRADRIPMVFVAKAGIPGDRQRWTIAHELGHLVLHANTPPPVDATEARRMETQAHRFAGAFLCPAEPLLETLRAAGGMITLRTLAVAKSKWGVAIKALVGRLQSIGVIDPDQARSLYKQISARRWSKEEPVNVSLETAQWLSGALLRKTGASDLRVACGIAAGEVGGDRDDLLTFSDWEEFGGATILRFARPHQEHP